MAHRIQLGFIISSLLLEARSARIKRSLDKQQESEAKSATPCGSAERTLAPPANTDGYTCGGRVNYLVNDVGMSSVDAGNQIANEFAVCAQCRAVDNSHPFPIARHTTVPAGGTCGSHMQWLVDNRGMTPEAAGAQIAAAFFAECSACGGDLACGAAFNTATPGGGTCGSRVEFLVNGAGISDAEAAAQVANEFPNQCSACGGSAPAPTPPPPTPPQPNPNPAPSSAGICGNSADVMVGNPPSSCIDRVHYVRDNMGRTETEAGNQVAGEFQACNECAEQVDRPPSNGHYCGIASSVYHCNRDADIVAAYDAQVADALRHSCMGYGGTHPPSWDGFTNDDRDMCSLNIQNDCSEWYEASPGNWQCRHSYGLNKNPEACQGEFLFLWDEPQTQGKSASWAAEQWQRHVDRWSSQIAALRARGVKVTSPMFTDHGGPATDKFAQFFQRCEELGIGCSDPNSNYYINDLLTNQWLTGAQEGHAGQEDWIRNTMATISRRFGNRRVVLGNFAWLGAQSADQQAHAITNSRIFDRDWSGLDAVFYFAARDFGGNTRRNGLNERTSSGQTLAQVLANRCRQYL